MSLAPWNPDMKLSSKYTLADLTITTTGLPNLPTTMDEINNLKLLAQMLEDLESAIGPFHILSAYRAHDVQVAVKNMGSLPPKKKTMGAALSFHEVGMAVDLWPTTMSIEEFFGKILAGDFKERLGEIALKPTQNAIHLSLPNERHHMDVTVMDAAGTYVKQTAEQIQKFAEPYLEMIAEALPDIAVDTSDDGKKNVKSWVWISGAVAALGALFLIFKPRKT